MKVFMKTTAMLLSACCLLSMLTGCSSGSGKSSQNIAEEELPYGSTMREDKKSFSVPMTYDRRFLDEEQVAKVADLCGAVQGQDAALYQATTFPFYVNYQMNDVYGLGSVDALIEKLHSSIASSTGEDYQFNMVLINDLATNTEAGELNVVCQMLSDAYDGEGSFMDTVQKAYDLTVEFNIGFNDNTTFAVTENQHIFLFQTADGWFALM